MSLVSVVKGFMFIPLRYQFFLLVFLSSAASSVWAHTDDFLSPEKKAQFIAAILNTQHYEHQLPSIITKTEWQELLLDRLLITLDRTQTGFGRWGLRQLLHPIADREELLRRQEIVRLLIEDEQTYQCVRQLLSKIHQLENALIVYWYPHDELSRDATNLYFSIPKLKDILNNQSLALEVGVITELFSSCSSLLMNLCLDGISNEITRWLFRDQDDLDLMHGLETGIKGPLIKHSLSLHTLAQKGQSDNPLDEIEVLTFKQYVRAAVFGSIGDRYKALSEGYTFDPGILNLPVVRSIIRSVGANKQLFKYPKVVAALFAVVPTIMYDIKWGNDIRRVAQQLLFVHRTLNALQHRLVEVRQVFDLVKVLNKELQAHEDLFQPLITLFNELSCKESLQHCNKLVHARTFAKDRSYIYSRGRVLRGQKLLRDAKKDLVPVLHAIAMIDAYFSIATLFKEYQANNMPCSFPLFIKQDTPCFAYEDAWIPLLQPKDAVANTVYAGTHDCPLKMVITGPNGCGKSTLLKMIGHLAVLAQSWGIVPASYARQTLFAGLHTGLDPHEDLPRGLSTFMAEKQRMQELHACIDASTQSNHQLVLIDEPYRGTVDDESARRIYAFGSTIAVKKHSVVCMATHVQKPIELAQGTNGAFTNYHVEILEPSLGTFKRTFKLKNGPAWWWFEDIERRARFVDWIGTERAQG